MSINILLKYIKAILPEDNIVPTTYNELLKKLKTPPILNKKICCVCYSEITTNVCSVPFCLMEKNKSFKNIPDFNIIYFDYTSDLKILIERNWTIILEYKTVLANKMCSDILNASNAKTICNNSISLILFVDGARFNKGKDGVFWAMLAMVSNFPLII